MRYIIVILIILTLPFNTLAKCINANDITQEDVVDVVYANSSKNRIPEAGCSKNWVKSQVSLKDVKRIVEVVDKEVNLCAKSQDSNESESINIEIGAIDYPIRSMSLNFRQYDTVRISYLPAVSGKITNDICENRNSDVKVFDVEKCKSDFLGKEYSSVISNNITAKDSNIVNYNNISTSGWINGPLYVVDPLDEKNENTLSRSMKFLQGYFASLNDLWNTVCTYDPTSYRDNTSKPYIENIRNAMNTYELNKICGNICHVKYDKDGKESGVTNTNCVFSVSLEKRTNNQYYTYLPSLFMREGNATGRLFSSVGTLSPQGIELNKEYSFNSITPSVWMDVIAGNNGGYKLLVTRKCTYHNKRSLYYYVGDSCPTVNPGDAGTTQIAMIDSSGDYVNKKAFEISSDWNGKSIYYGIKDNGDGEDNNSGYFELTTTVPKAIKTPFADIVTWVTKYVDKILYGSNTSVNPGAVGRIYRTLIDGPFVTVIQSVLILYISVYSLLYIIGMLRSSQMELIVILIKIGIIFILISPNSWQFFNENLFKLFKEGSIDLINIMSSDSDSDSKFKFIDKSLVRFAESGTWVQIFSLILTGPIGFICTFAIIWGVWMLFVAILRAIIIFLISIIIVALLLSLAPLFISFILFKRTKPTFDNWVKVLANIAIQPVMIFATIAMFNEIIMGVTYALLNYDVCTQCVAYVNILDKVQAFCLLDTYLPRTYVATSTYIDLAKETYDGFSFFGVPILLPSLIAFVILTHCLASFICEIPKIVSSIFNLIETELSQQSHGGPAQRFEDSMRAVVAQDSYSRNNRARSNYMKQLMDHPKANNDVRDQERKREKIDK